MEKHKVGTDRRNRRILDCDISDIHGDLASQCAVGATYSEATLTGYVGKLKDGIFTASDPFFADEPEECPVRSSQEVAVRLIQLINDGANPEQVKSNAIIVAFLSGQSMAKTYKELGKLLGCSESQALRNARKFKCKCLRLRLAL